MRLVVGILCSSSPVAIQQLLLIVGAYWKQYVYKLHGIKWDVSVNPIEIKHFIKLVKMSKTAILEIAI